MTVGGGSALAEPRSIASGIALGADPSDGGLPHGSLSVLAFRVGIAYAICMQYTLREIPPTVDSELRQRAKLEGKSLNAVAIEALIRGAGLSDNPIRVRDLSDIAGTWQEDPEFDQAIADQDRIDERLWR